MYQPFLYSRVLAGVPKAHCSWLGNVCYLVVSTGLEVEEQLELEAVALNEMMLNNLRQYADVRFGRLTEELRHKQKLQQLWKARRDAWRTLNIQQVRTGGYTH